MVVPVLVSSKSKELTAVSNDEVTTETMFLSCLPKESLWQGKFEFGDTEKKFDTLPPWFNIQLAREGQLFAQRRLYGMFYSHLVALYFLLGTRDSCHILYYTRKSDTEEKALHRYLATLLQVKLWYESEILNDTACPFFKSLINVRKIHANMGKRVAKERPDFSAQVVPVDHLEIKNSKELWKAFRTDFVSSELGQKYNEDGLQQAGYRGMTGESQYFSQYDMALTQWSFVSIPILFPETLGLYDAKEEEIEAFIHLWAIIGHCLGMDPKYNICLCKDITTFRDVSWYLYEVAYLREFPFVCYENEVMWAALTKGMVHIIPFLTLEGILLEVLEDFVGVPGKETRKQSSLRIWWHRLLQTYVVRPLLRFQWFQNRANRFVNAIVEKATQKYCGYQSTDYGTVAKKAFY